MRAPLALLLAATGALVRPSIGATEASHTASVAPRPRASAAEPVAVSRAATGDSYLAWKGERYPLDELPDHLSEAARGAIAAFRPWAAAQGYGMHLDPFERVLLLRLAPGTRADAELELIAECVRFVDARFPRPDPARVRSLDDPRAGDAQEDDPATGDEPLPEDPDGGIPPWEEEGYGDTSDIDRGTEPTEYVWGSDDVEPDTQTIVLLVVDDQLHFDGLLEYLAGRYPYLDPWLKQARKQQGFSLQAPLAGAYVANYGGQEEWSPDGELVNRVTQLLLARRFGTLPNWLVQGAAWAAELELRGAVYCFPFRDEFVGIGEHTDWNRSLEQFFDDRRSKKKRLRASEFVGWRRGKFENFAGRVSWGVVDFLSRYYPDELPALAQAFANHRAAHARVDAGDGTWSRDRDYVIPVDEQEALLELHTNANLWADLTRYFREGDEFEMR